MKNITTHILVKITALVALLALLNILYHKTLWYNDIDKYSDTLENLWPNQNNSDIIYFGESSNFYQEHPDTPKIRISDYLNKMFPDLVIEEVDNAGLVASNYLHIMRHIPNNSKVKAIIVTLNLRSFGPTWIFDANSNYLKMADEMIKPRPALLNRFFIALKNYDFKEQTELETELKNAWQKPLVFNFKLPYATLDAWNTGMGNGGILKTDGSWDMENIPIACHFIKNYAFNIDTTNNPRINDFDEIVRYAQKRGWTLYLHLLSENVDECQKLVGQELVQIIKTNAKLLENRYHKPAKNVLVINNLETVPNEHFRDRKFPTEHYNNFGKKLCAKKLAEALLQKEIYLKTP